MSTSGGGAAVRRLGRYHLSDPLGGGPTGEVYRAKVYGVAGFERQFAVKRFHPEFVKDPNVAAQIAAAARLYGSLEHPRIARLQEHGVAGGETFTATELVNGLDIARLIAAGYDDQSSLVAGAVVALVSQIARTIGYAHGRGIAHLGVCPTNLICTLEGEVKVTDFGFLPPRLPNRPANDYSLQARIPYLAPEQLAGESTSPATDVFQLGVVACELFTGKRCFEGPTPFETAQEILSGRPQEPDLPKPLLKVLRRCLARSPFERFPDAGALADALDAATRTTPLPGDRRDVSTIVRRASQRIEEMNEQQISGALWFPLPAPPPATTPTPVPTRGPAPPPTPPPSPPPRPIPRTPPPTPLARLLEEGASIKPPLGKRPATEESDEDVTIPHHSMNRVEPDGSDGDVTQVRHRDQGFIQTPEDLPTPPPIPLGGDGQMPAPPPIGGSPADFGGAAIPMPVGGDASAIPMPVDSSPIPHSLEDQGWGGGASLGAAGARPEAGGSSPIPMPLDSGQVPLSNESSAPVPIPQLEPEEPEIEMVGDPAASFEPPVPPPFPIAQLPSDPMYQSPPVAPQPRRGRKGLWITLAIVLAGAGGYLVYDQFILGEETATKRVAVASQDAGEQPVAPADAGAAVGAPDANAVAVVAPPADAAVAAPVESPVDAAPPVASGQLMISSKPDGAQVYLDGTLKGKTPITVDGINDRQSLAVIKPGFKLHTAEIDGQGRVEVTLEPVAPPNGPAGIKVRCKKKNRYYVFVDGADIGQLCPTERIGVEKGDHVVEIYDPVTEQRQTYPVSVTQTRNSVRVRVD